MIFYKNVMCTQWLQIKLGFKLLNKNSDLHSIEILNIVLIIKFKLKFYNQTLRYCYHYKLKLIIIHVFLLLYL